MKTKILLNLLFGTFVQATFTQWQQVNGTPYVYSLNSHNGNIYSGTGYGLIISTNSGANWSQTSLTASTLSFAASENNFFAGTSTAIYRSTNAGVNWTNINSASLVRTIVIIGGNVVAGFSGGVKVSTNNGANWVQSNLAFDVMALTVSGTDIYAGTLSMGVYRSTNNGLNWNQTSLNIGYMRSMSSSGNYIYAGSFGSGIFISTNNGANWSQSLIGNNIYALASIGGSVYAGCDTGVYVSNNNGSSWERRNEGLGSYIRMGSLCVFNQDLFAGKESLSGIGIYKRPLIEISVLEQISNEIPSAFKLKQNYPNPFNPATIIEFSVPKSSYVKLAVYDMTGKEVDVLVSQNLNAGIFKTNWDASKYSSGVYFYTIRADDYHDSKKMILIK